MDHIVRDLIVRWQRTVILVVLTAIGLMIWVTYLIHSVLEEPSRNRAMTEAAESTTDTSPKTVRLFQDKSFLNELPEKSLVMQDLHNRRQQSDPLARSIEVSAVHSKYFRSRINPLSIPVSISGDENGAPSTKRHASPSFKSTEELRLTETFIDEMPRAAVIDGKRCLEGTQVQMGGKTFRVTNIGRNSVELLRNSELIVLRLQKMN